MFDALIDKLNVARSLNQDTAVAAYDTPTVTDKVVELNTQEQLFDKGEDDTGRPLDSIGGDYTTTTKLYKRQQGQPVDRVTLKDTGAFYESFNASVQYNGDIVIEANTIKDGEDLQYRWGKGILGLQQKSKEIIQTEIREEIIKEVRKLLWISVDTGTTIEAMVSSSRIRRFNTFN